MNGNRSYNPHAKTLPGQSERRDSPLKLVVSNDGKGKPA